MNSLDLVIGLHSIVAALKNPHRGNKILYMTSKGAAELKSRGKLNLSQLKEFCRVEMLGSQEFQDMAQRLYSRHKFVYQRIPGQILLAVDGIELGTMAEFYREFERGKIKRVLCLDQVTDVQNAAAVLRTGAFYGVSHLIVAGKGSFRMTPAFYRTSCGAVEYVKVISVGNLSRTLSRLKEQGILLLGLSEEGELPLDEAAGEKLQGSTSCLILGAEDRGLSHVVRRCIGKTFQLFPQGPIKTLNVSTAAAVGMEKIWGSTT